MAAECGVFLESGSSNLTVAVSETNIIRTTSHAAKGAESPIHRDNNPVDKTCAGAAQPDQCSDKFPWLPKTAGGRVGDNRLSACCEIVVFIKNQAGLLFTDEKAPRDGA